MLPKTRRIPRRELGPVIFKGKKYTSPHLILSLFPTEEKTSKFVFSLSKKVCKSAVLRNKYRRRGYSIISKHLNTIKNGYLLMFSFKKDGASISFSELEKEIMTLLSDSFMLS